MVILPSPSPAAETYELTPPERQVHQAKVELQVRGELKLLDPDKKERQIPFEVSGEFLYDEQIDAAADLHAARYYHAAQAEIKYEKTTHQPRLPADRRLIGVQKDEADLRYWSPGGPLSRDESELIDLQASSVLLSALLPESPVQVGDTWKPDDQSLAAFVGLDALTANETTCKLAEVKAGRAVVEISGRATGAADGVASEIELSAKYGYHLNERRFTSLAMALKEKRAVGQAEPGFEATARLTMILSPVASSAQLTEGALASIRAGAKAAPPLRYESNEQGVRLVLDPRWRVIIERPEVTVFRLVDEGDVIAQCNVSTLPPLAAGRQIQLEEFQEDIKKALADNFGQFVEASQGETEKGLRMLRVTVAGEASELAIHWIYYHISNDEGRRISYVFTLEAEQVERFAAADAAFTSSLELFPPKTDSAAPAAKQARADSAPKG